jgi:DNA-directed RNA polymerase specialized sigma subunit
MESEEIERLSRLARRGVLAARNAIVMGHLGLVGSVVRRITRGRPPCAGTVATREDLVQEGVLHRDAQVVADADVQVEKTGEGRRPG